MMNCYVDEMEWKSFSFETFDLKLSEIQRKIRVCKNKKAKNVPQGLCNYLYGSDNMRKYLKNGKAFINWQVYFFSCIAFLHF